MLKGKFKNMSRTILIVGLFTTLIGCQYSIKNYAHVSQYYNIVIHD